MALGRSNRIRKSVSPLCFGKESMDSESRGLAPSIAFAVLVTMELVLLGDLESVGIG